MPAKAPAKKNQKPKAPSINEGQREAIRRAAQIQLARLSFYEYMRLTRPNFYTPEKEYLRETCEKLQAFIDQDEKQILVLNLPPRFGKSTTAVGLTEWLFGRDYTLKVMTGSYNETLSTTFATQVRDTIQTRKTSNRVVYSDIFPATRLKYGESAAALWALEGNGGQKSYLATSPTGTATGFGANVMLLDDIVKNAAEAYNENVLDKHWDWYTKTMMQRLEGNYKIIIIMTRWALGDLAGRILTNYPDDTQLISYSAVQEDGSMLCDTVLSAKDYKLKTKEMSQDIVDANYNQKPIDISGRLYPELRTYDEIPHGEHQILNYTDTADTGKDFLCSITYFIYEQEAYIVDIVFDNAAMEETEPKVAAMLFRHQVHEATIESNNGGRGFSRNIKRELEQKHKSNKTVIMPVPQTKNKEARILASASWVVNHVYLPPNWRARFPEFARQVTTYQAKGKNAHDDAPDVLAAIYERVTGKMEPKVYNKAMTGLYTKAGRRQQGS